MVHASAGDCDDNKNKSSHASAAVGAVTGTALLPPIPASVPSHAHAAHGHAGPDAPTLASATSGPNALAPTATSAASGAFALVPARAPPLSQTLLLLPPLTLPAVGAGSGAGTAGAGTGPGAAAWGGRAAEPTVVAADGGAGYKSAAAAALAVNARQQKMLAQQQQQLMANVANATDAQSQLGASWGALEYKPPQHLQRSQSLAQALSQTQIQAQLRNSASSGHVDGNGHSHNGNGNGNNNSNGNAVAARAPLLPPIPLPPVATLAAFDALAGGRNGAVVASNNGDAAVSNRDELRRQRQQWKRAQQQLVGTSVVNNGSAASDGAGYTNGALKRAGTERSMGMGAALTQINKICHANSIGTVSSINNAKKYT